MPNGSAWCRWWVLVAALAVMGVSLWADAPEKQRAPRGKPTEAGKRHAGAFGVNPMDGAKMVWVPAGEFPMGSQDAAARSDEKPVHRVKLTRGFWLYQTAVTNAQYGNFLAANPRHEKPIFWTDERFNGKRQPVVGVAWQDARDYATWAKAALPTEAQSRLSRKK